MLLALLLPLFKIRKFNFLNIKLLGNYKLITAKVGDFTIKSKVTRETEIPSQNVKLHIPAEKCCVYENNKLI